MRSVSLAPYPHDRSQALHDRARPARRGHDHRGAEPFLSESRVPSEIVRSCGRQELVKFQETLSAGISVFDHGQDGDPLMVLVLKPSDGIGEVRRHLVRWHGFGFLGHPKPAPLRPDVSDEGVWGVR
jgi:hypothetical protein